VFGVGKNRRAQNPPPRELWAGAKGTQTKYMSRDEWVLGERNGHLFLCSFFFGVLFRPRGGEGEKISGIHPTGLSPQLLQSRFQARVFWWVEVESSLHFLSGEESGSTGQSRVRCF